MGRQSLIRHNSYPQKAYHLEIQVNCDDNRMFYVHRIPWKLGDAVNPGLRDHGKLLSQGNLISTLNLEGIRKGFRDPTLHVP